MKKYVADFETTTLPEDCRVWAYAIVDIEDINNVINSVHLLSEVMCMYGPYTEVNT